MALGAGAFAPAQARADKPRSTAAKESRAEEKAAKRARTAKARGRAAAAAGTLATVTVTAAAMHNNSEARLLGVIELVERQQLDAALKAAASLTADVPHFQAAQLVYADLLRFRTGRPPALGYTPAPAPARAGILVKNTVPAAAPVPAEAQEWQAQLQGLQQELRQRVQGAASLPPTGSIPSEFLVLGPSVRHAIAIDASKSRLYLFANEDGKLRLTGDFYVSVGKLGMDKAEEGDQRTPQGMYFIGREIPGRRLPDLYGKGALTVNYPNDWDRAMGRSGAGIWLHGSPPQQFARLPQASDGCVVLANPDLTLLMKTVAPQTPVLIRDRLQWGMPADLPHKQAVDGFMPVLAAWQQVWASADPGKLDTVYAADFRASEPARASQQRLAAMFKNPDVSVQEVSVYSWRDAKGEIRIANLRVKSKAFAETLPLRQYWRKSGDRWILFSEEVQGYARQAG
ncbi:MAG: L,D-transpeptidase family protein [Comamonas sp.]